MIALVAFFFLAVAIASPWFERKNKVWGTLLALACVSGLYAGLFSMLGLAWTLLLAYFWAAYREKASPGRFIALVVLSLALKLQLLPGFFSMMLTSKFSLGVQGILIGLFPLALIVPLSYGAKEWRRAMEGAFLGIGGIAIMAILAVLTSTVSFDCKVPTWMALRTFSNLFFTSIPEEAFYRGFLQNNLCRYFKSRWAGLLVTSVIFTAAHIFWSPGLGVLSFVFIASLLYGGVYLWSGRIESAILTHFLLNFIHQSCFTYHAL